MDLNHIWDTLVFLGWRFVFSFHGICGVLKTGVLTEKCAIFCSFSCFTVFFFFNTLICFNFPS